MNVLLIHEEQGVRWKHGVGTDLLLNVGVYKVTFDAQGSDYGNELMIWADLHLMSGMRLSVCLTVFSSALKFERDHCLSQSVVHFMLDRTDFRIFSCVPGGHSLFPLQRTHGRRVVCSAVPAALYEHPAFWAGHRLKSNGACEIKKFKKRRGTARYAKRMRSEVQHTPFHTRDSHE